VEREGIDPMLYRAIVQPDLPTPKATLADAARIYSSERLGENPSKSARNTFEKIKRRLTTSLGPLDSIPLTSLKREHARKVRDDLLKTPKEVGNGLLSPSSVRREMNSVKALVALGIKEFDLTGKVDNPFERLELPASQKKRGGDEWELRDPRWLG